MKGWNDVNRAIYLALSWPNEGNHAKDRMRGHQTRAMNKDEDPKGMGLILRKDQAVL